MSKQWKKKFTAAVAQQLFDHKADLQFALQIHASIEIAKTNPIVSIVRQRREGDEGQHGQSDGRRVRAHAVPRRARALLIHDNTPRGRRCGAQSLKLDHTFVLRVQVLVLVLNVCGSGDRTSA